MGQPLASPAHQERVRLDSLTGLRFLAAILVFGHHLDPLYANTPAAVLVHRLTQPGASGVSFFFVLSGFVLTWSYRSNDHASDFYRRRFARIAPAYWVAVTVFVPLTIANHPHAVGRQLLHIAPAYLAIQAWFPDMFIYWAGNGVAWSLSCEVFFYAVFPALILLVVRATQRQRIIMMALLAVVVAAVPAILHPVDEGQTVSFWFIYILPVQRLWEFGIGMLLALWIRGGGRVGPLWTSLALVFIGYAAAIFAPVYLGWVAIMFLPFAAVIASAAAGDIRGRTSLLRHPTMVRLGEWSFAFYLTHQIVIKVASRVLNPGSVLWATLVSAMCLAASLLAAYLLYALVERPLERRLRHGTLPISAGGGGHLAEEPAQTAPRRPFPRIAGR